MAGQVLIKCVVLVFLVCINTALGEKVDQWEKFKEEYNKVYNSTEMELHHYKNFKLNLKEIKRHNALYKQGLVTYLKGINQFADLSDEEFVNLYGLTTVRTKIYTDTVNRENVTDTDLECLDWREKGAVTRVKDQGKCGACWIFSAVGVLEGHHFRKTKKLLTLSEQNLVDCISEDTCEGGWTPSVFRHLLSGDRAINKEEDYPYKAVNDRCNPVKSEKVQLDFTEYTHVPETEEALKKAVAEQGPIAISLYAGKHWKLYKSGVWYEEECSPWVNHALVVVGYGRENENDYWLIKNSFGKDWGENGYIKLARNKHDDYCGITTYAYYVK